MGPKTFFNLLKETFKEWQKDKVARLAAALSYYTVFSLAPLMLITLAIVRLVYAAGQGQELLIQQIQGLVGKTGAEFFRQVIETGQSTEKSVVATIIGIVTMFLGASGVFLQLKDALNTVWGIEDGSRFKGISGFVRVRAISFTSVIVLGFLLLVSLIVSAGLSALFAYAERWIGDIAILGIILNLVISLGMFTLVFAAMFKYLPDVSVSWRDVWIGAFFTAVLFSLGKLLIGVYLGRSAFADTYGAAASLVVVLLWVFYSAQIVLFGAEFTQVYSTKFSPRRVKEPVKAAAEDAVVAGEPVTGVALTPNVVMVDEKPLRLARAMDEEEAHNVIAGSVLFVITAATAVLVSLFGKPKRRRNS
ncbi:MAG TPA: YihY/virulence factor BrkB family protein [Bellilinea sp.]|nr:YihY/virulence factor BrkB family protein [Bellilinea sp.]